MYDDGPATSITTDQQLFVRFGVEGANVSGALLQQGTCALDVDLRPVVGGSLAASGVKVFSGGSTSARVFHPLLSGVAFEDIAELRSTVRVEGGSGAILVIAGWQLSDDGITWYDAAGTAGSFTTFGGEQTNDGTTYGTTFATQTVADGNKRRKAVRGRGQEPVGHEQRDGAGVPPRRLPEDLMPVFTDLEAEGLQHAILPQRGVFAVATDPVRSRWSALHFDDKLVLKQMSCAELANDVNEHEIREAAARAMYLVSGNPDMAELADREDRRGDEARDELCEKCNFNGQYREHCGIHGAGLI